MSNATEMPWVCVRHATYEEAGLFAEVAGGRGIELRTIATDLGDEVPTADGLGGVIVLGGPYSVADAPTRPHLADERRLLGEAVTRGLPVLGICLGSQLLASALGATVSRAPVAERGIREVTLTSDGADDPVLGPCGSPLQVFQFHEDMFELPPDATALATSTDCPQQGFRFGARAYGFQFHIELTDPFAEFVPESCRPSDAERAALATLGRGIIERFFDLAAA